MRAFEQGGFGSFDGWTHRDLGELGLPPGRHAALEERGTIFYREVPGPPDAPTLVLLHGWIASSGLNWFQAFRPLSRYFRIIAPDLRGHARGIRSWWPFSLKQCADDVAALVEHLETGPVIAVGYSMGGAVAQLLWRRHPECVAGLVLCATSHTLVPNARDRLVFGTAAATLAGTTRLSQLWTLLPRAVAKAVVPEVRLGVPEALSHWAAEEMARHDVRMILEAGSEVGRYDASRWIGRVDVPTAQLVTIRDRAMDPSAQLRTALEIPGATVHRMDDGHLACARSAFGAPLVAACCDVAARV